MPWSRRHPALFHHIVRPGRQNRVADLADVVSRLSPGRKAVGQVAHCTEAASPCPAACPSEKESRNAIEASGPVHLCRAAGPAGPAISALIMTHPSL